MNNCQRGLWEGYCDAMSAINGPDVSHLNRLIAVCTAAAENKQLLCFHFLIV